MKEDFFSLMERRNPLALKEGDRVLDFPNYQAVYLYVIEALYKECPQGYVDLVVFLCEHCGMEKKQAEDFIPTFVRTGLFVKKDPLRSLSVFLLDWEDFYYLLDRLPRFFRGLHWILETLFDRDSFMAALYEFANKHNINHA